MPKDICDTGLDDVLGQDIKDSYMRRINYLRVSVTDRCNLRCFYCMPEAGISRLEHDDILRYEEILRVIRISVENGINKVRITGGEPLVRKGITGFIKDVAGIDGLKDFSLTTNGILLNELAQDIYDAGLKRINISIDSLNDETYEKITKHYSLKRVMTGLKKAYGVGFSPIKVNVVIIRGLNDGEVVDFAKLTEEYPFSVRFIEYMPIGDDNKWDEKFFISSKEIKDKISAYSDLEPVEKLDKSSPAMNYRITGAKGTIGFISPLSKHFCSLCNRLRLTADGKLRNCLFSENEVDIKTALRTGKTDEDISNIIRQSIMGKPEGHKGITEDAEKKRAMHSIGG
jgi:cyclic pyranopterin phosphate synthase